MGGLSSAEFYIEAVVVLLAAVIVGGILALTWFYPFQLLFTTVHELGHVFARLISGGEVEGFKIFFRPNNGMAGVTDSLVKTDDEQEKENLQFIISAGYMGTALFTTGLILMTGFPYLAPYAITFLAVVFAISAFGYGRNVSTFIISFGLAALFIWVAWNAPLIGSVFLLYLLAVMGIIRAFNDRRTIISLARNDPNGIHDAAQMAKISRRSALFWARLWSYSTLLMIAIAIGLIWLRPLINFVELS